jgi:acyl dehydratase
LVTTKVDLDDAAGRPVATVASTLAVRPPDQLAGVADRPGPAAAPRSPRRDRLSDAVAASGPGAPAPTPATVATAQTGDKIGSFAGALARADLARYASASGDFNPIHLDEAAARAAGLPGLIAHGMLTMGRAIQPVVDWAGADPGAVRDYSARFAHPAPVPALGGAELTIAGRVAAAEADAVTVELTVAVAGRKVLAQARAVVRRPGR